MFQNRWFIKAAAVDVEIICSLRGPLLTLGQLYIHTMLEVVFWLVMSCSHTRILRKKTCLSFRLNMFFIQ